MSEFRKGVCKDCSAEFNIPKTFPHDRAKCRQCGGTVEIAPAEAAPAKPAPKPVPAAAPPAPKPRMDKPKPAKPKLSTPAKKSMTMKDKIIARKKAAAESTLEAPAEQVKPKKKPEPKAKVAPSTKRNKEQSGTDRGNSRRKAPARRSSKRRSARDTEEQTGRNTGRRARPEKKPPVGGMIGVAALVLVAAGGWYFLAGPGKSDSKQVDMATAQVLAEADSKLEEERIADEKAQAEVAQAEAAEAEKELKDEAKAKEQAAAESKKKATKKVKVYEPMAVTYDEYSIFGPAIGTTDEEWTELQELGAIAADMSAGARQGRATKKLKEFGYKAVPVVLNEFRKIDLSDDEGNRLGDLMQRTVSDLLNGKNAGWLYDQENGMMIPRAHAHNRKVVLLFLKMWDQVVNDPTAWIAVAKLGTKKYADQLATYSKVLLAEGITDGEFIEYVGGTGAESETSEEDDLDDF